MTIHSDDSSDSAQSDTEKFSEHSVTDSESESHYSIKDQTE